LLLEVVPVVVMVVAAALVVCLLDMQGSPQVLLTL
jgi:hypothetical protein